MHVIKDDPSVADVVASVWKEVLPHADFDRALTLNEAGVDSLKSLHFMLHLEERLGRPISFDLLTQRTTVGELLDRLCGVADPNQISPTVAAHTVFLFPGIYGDEPILAELRRSLDDEVRFILIDPPDVDAPVDLSSNLKAMAALVSEEIVNHSAEGTIHLAGYSYGGFLAFATAHALQQRGRRIGLVTLLDCMTGDRAASAVPDAAARAWAQDREHRRANRPGHFGRLSELFEDGPLLFVDRVAFRLAIEAGALGLAQQFVRASARRHGFDRSFRRRRELLLRLRGRSLRRWRPQALQSDVLLITSDEYDLKSDPQVWPVLCPRLTVQPVGGQHREIFEPEALLKLKPALLNALARAERSTEAGQ